MRLTDEPTQWLSTLEFARWAAIEPRRARRALQRCHEGKPWRGLHLTVEVMVGVGGKSGRQYKVLKCDLGRANEREQRSTGFALPASSVCDVAGSPAVGRALPCRRHNSGRQAEFKASVLKPIRATEPGSVDRRAAIEEASKTARYTYGKRRGELVGANTIRAWLKASEKDGLAGLMRAGRADKGKRRVWLSRKLDDVCQAIGMDDTQLEDLHAKVLRRVRSLWANGVPGRAKVQMNAMPYIVKLLQEAGCTMPLPELRSLCLLPINFIEAERQYQAVAIYRKDAARSAATQVPRIRRDRSHLQPMEWVAADVHHFDVVLKRTDGSLYTPKAVAWLDLATNRAFVSVFAMEKGEMIRQEHVIQSFAEMCTHPNWGCPTRIYSDNGGEYNWLDLAGDLFKLVQSGREERRITVHDIADLDSDLEPSSGVTRSRPWTPQSKVVETFFSNIERTIMPQIPGHIGGDRMKKKSENQGKAPVPYQGTIQDFKTRFAKALAYYECFPQRGHLNGKSPKDSFDTFVKAGWTSVMLDPSQLAFALAREHTRQVKLGGVISFNAIAYRHDALVALVGQTVTVREPLIGDGAVLYIMAEGGEMLCEAEQEKVYPFGAIEGAGEQQRQHAVLRRGMRELSSDVDKLDLENVMDDVVAMHSPAAAASPGATITIDPRLSSPARRTRHRRDEMDEETRKAEAQLAAYALLAAARVA